MEITDQVSLYNAEDKSILKIAEDSLNSRLDRVQEIKVPSTDLLPGYKVISCNPAGQAKYLEEKGIELNIMIGLFLGHDMIFNAKSAAPVTPLIVKDRVLKHYSLERLKQ